MPFISGAMFGVFVFKLFALSTMVRVFSDFRIPWTLSVGYAFIHAGAALLEGHAWSSVALSTTFVLLMCQLMLQWLRDTEETILYWIVVVCGVALLTFFPQDIFAFLREVDGRLTGYEFEG